ncbi:MAG: class I SAM-dependent methyltransferase [Armatimonadetes bacterium]|nr:class I SAM-dependent methyltransferase [Armatimonadota bacterium]
MIPFGRWSGLERGVEALQQPELRQERAVRALLRDPAGRRVVGSAGQAVWDLAHRLLSAEEPGRLLEAAAGGGDLAAQLARRGFRVVGTDLVNQWRQPDVPFVLADLDMPLPFADGAFDAALLAEALGYLENPSQMLRRAEARQRAALLLLVCRGQI